ncbi:1A family penicillin-binding protein [Actibacterium atlanticum]|uniref:peptidoglycan glycosyltransferase n=1 Tax=Actibacterium atlanticum TaxID=1461693 RepID=A0A058ZLZ8_9RHOB|nr:PBP1A family penicillin-binding protein [Actibacterium atlanticum]KCV82215.1 1A family penicillin-binding protein [Actibacterium atlanticum]
MSGTNGKKPPLRAEKRYGTATKRTKPAPNKVAKPKPKRQKTASAGGNGRIRGAFGALLRWIARLIWKVTSRTALVCALILGAAVVYTATTLPDVASLLDARTRGSVTLIDREGEIFAWRGDQYGGQITASSVSKHLKHAVVATEDKRFYRHFGISPRGVASAVRINLSEGRGPLSGHGGSTLTQQTAKLLCLGVPFDPETWDSEAAYEADCRRTTIWRKAKEAIYAMAMEARFSKDEILTIYLNRAYLGASARGFQAAAQRYFGIDAANLNPAQSAMLAGLLTAPTRLAPTNNLQRSQDRAATVVRLMYEQEYLTTAERDQAWENPATLSKAAEKRAGGYFADWVMDTAPSFLTRETTEDVFLYTTLDQRLQTAAEDAMKLIFETKVREGSLAQAAIVVMSSDGAVRAMVGGRETKVSGAFNRASMAMRQTGSAFKPFVYGAALDLGFTPNATVVDEPWCMDVPGSGEYCPKNYTKDFKGRVTLAQALAQSLNIPAIRVSESVGRENVGRVAEDFGIESDLAVGPAIALGTSESTLIEMTGAYAGILNGGQSVRPYGLTELRLQGDDAPLIGKEGGLGERVITEQAARSLTWMMHQVTETGTGQRAKLPDRQTAGKTGTTQAARDAWFIGFTADYVAGVWMGYDDNTPLTGVTGGGLPAEIWRETMVRVHEGLPARALPMDAPLKAVAPAPQAQERKKKRKLDDRAERVLIDVLRNLLDKN